MARVIVYVSGGNIQGVLSDEPGSQVMIVDYDNEKETTDRMRTFESISYNPIYFNRTMAGAED
jgi:hypothetical protein